MVANTLRNIIVVGGSFVGRVSSIIIASLSGILSDLMNSQQPKSLQRSFLQLIGYVQTRWFILRQY